jgi:hypothetical protein
MADYDDSADIHRKKMWDDNQRNLEHIIEQREQAGKEGKKYVYSGSRRTPDIGLDEPPSRLAEMIGKLGTLLIFAAGIVYFFKINAPTIMGLSFSRLAFQSGILFMVMGFYPYLLIGFLWVFAFWIVFAGSRTATGLQLSAVTSYDWMLAVGSVILAIVLKKVLVSRD